MVIANFKRRIKARIPILKWLPQYKLKDALGDLVAGLTVGLTLIPQVHIYIVHDICLYDRLMLFSRYSIGTKKNVIFAIAGDSLCRLSGLGAAIWAL